MKSVVVIPARYGSTRFPGKVLKRIDGKPIVQHVYEQSIKAELVDEVYIATDSEQVYSECIKFTDSVVMTRNDHKSGTDRIIEVMSRIDSDLVINVQGDEPLIEPELITKIIQRLMDQDSVMASACTGIMTEEDYLNPNVVKVVFDNSYKSQYFSRSPIPYYREGLDWDRIESPIAYRHIGIYGYTKDFLMKIPSLSSSQLEENEKLEQLRFLENGYNISMVLTDYESIGVDTEEDYLKIKNYMEKKNGSL